MYKKNKINRLFLDYLPNLAKAEIKRFLPFMAENLSFKKKNASLNITDRCNLRCIMCKQWRQENKQEISTEKWFDTIKQLKDIGIEEINFTGGEPLLRDDIFEMVKYASSLGITCGITTNGSLLTQNIINKLVESGIKIFTLSIDALNEEYEKIRGVEKIFKNVENAVELLSRLRKNKKIDVNISFVLMKKTLKHLQNVLSFCKKWDLPIVVCLLDKSPYLFDLKSQSELWINEDDSNELKQAQELLLKEKRNNSNFIYNNFSDFSYFIDYFKDPIQKNIPCVISQLRIFIDSAGDVFGGCWSLGKFGNINQNSLAEIISSGHYKDTHKKMFFKNCPGCSCGYSTNLRYLPGRLIKTHIKSLFINKK
jgi:MoaA/NifB/PqqE/SkfB family radical SAM enzyme